MNAVSNKHRHLHKTFDISHIKNLYAREENIQILIMDLKLIQIIQLKLKKLP